VLGADVKATTHPPTIVSFAVSIVEQNHGIARQENTKDFLKIIM